MIDHMGLQVSDLNQSKTFYQLALAPLGYTLLMELSKEQTGGFSGAGFGQAPKPDFWLGEGSPNEPRIHVAFTAPDQATVDAFHQAALLAGGRCNGKPGLRPQYHPKYYGAFVLDPDGHNIEAVFHG